MKRTTRLCLQVIAVVVLLVCAVSVQAGESRRGGRLENRLQKQLDEIALTPEQKEKVDAILAETKQQRVARRAEMREAFQTLHRLLDHDPPDEPAIMRQIEAIGTLKTERHKRMMAALLRIRAELTPEQREKLRELRQHRHHRGKHRHGDASESD